MSSIAPTPFALPGASDYATAATMANNAYNNALAQINKNRLNTLTSYGYTGAVDPQTGVVSGVRVDPKSIYGQLQQLFHTQALEDRNAEFAAEDRGLHGGLANQALSENRYQHQGQDVALGNQLQSSLDDFQNQQQQAKETRDNALWQAEQAALIQELQKELSDLGSGGGGGGDGGDNGNGGGSGTAPLTRTLGGITVPDSVYWQIKGVPGPGDAKKKAINRIVGGGAGGRALAF